MRRPRARYLPAAAVIAALTGLWSPGVAAAQQGAGSPGRRCPERLPVVVPHGPASPTTRIVGKVVDAESGIPIRGVVVTLGSGERGRAVTGADGSFEIHAITAGSYDFAAEGPSFYGRQATCLEIPADQEVTLTIGLHPRPVAMEPLRVDVDAARPLWLVRAGFYRRAKAGGGIFISREDIEKKDPSRLSEMFVGRAEVSVADANPSPLQPIQAVHPPPGVPHDCPMGNGNLCRRPQDTGPCPVQYLVDGQRVPLILGVDTFHPKDVAAIEAYFHASDIPPQFNVGNAACGVINIWLKVHPGRR